MKILNDSREYILQNYAEINHLIEEVNFIKNDLDKLCEKICTEIKEKDWWIRWSNDFEGPVYRWNSIFFWKKSWHFGNDSLDIIDLDVSDIGLDHLMGTTDNKPNSGIWTKRLTKLGDGEKEKFEQYFREISKQMKLDVPRSVFPNESVIGHRLPYNVDEWIKILKDGRFIDVILEQFDNLSLYIEPIDKALTMVRKIKK
ncbi:MAG: hypothetical protein KGZ86_00790 [Candidatus Latescibacteria bacterium]|nr:hypothetical protein [Candidatus Latescibacterota bacterium]